MNPLVSVVMATHGRPKIARRAMDSVLNQTFGNLELVVVADGPDPEKRKWVTELDERIVYDELASWSGAKGNYCRNRGIQIARGDYLMFLDDDDTFADDNSLHWIMSHAPFTAAVWSCKAPWTVLSARDMLYAPRQGFPEVHCTIQFMVRTPTAKKVGWPLKFPVGSVPFWKSVYTMEFGDVIEPAGLKAIESVQTLAYGAIRADDGERMHDYSPMPPTDL